MYHYVRDPETFKGSVPISKKEFRHQMEQLVKKFDIVSPDDLEKRTTKNRCVITFDDGTKDQYENAYQVLKEMGLPGYFTVMSGPFVDKQIPVFHLVHTLLSNWDDDEIWSELKENYSLPDLSNAHNFYSYENSISRRYIKYLLNFAWNTEASRKFLLKKINEKYQDLNAFINSYYISPNEFIEMNHNGMTIGVHAHKHKGFGGLGQDFFKEEISPCIEYMKTELKICPYWYTPAFGGGENKTEMRIELEGLLKENGIKGVFTTQEGINNGLESYWMNRYDCNQFEKVMNLM